MPVSTALASFNRGFKEVRALLDMASEASMKIGANELLAPQQVLTRAAVVALCAHLQGFFEDVSGEYVNSLSADLGWDARSVGVKTFVSRHVRTSLRESIKAASGCSDEAEVDRFRIDVLRIQAWLDNGSFQLE